MAQQDGRLGAAPRSRLQSRYKLRSTRRCGLDRERTTARRLARTGRRVRNHTIPRGSRLHPQAMGSTAYGHRGAPTYRVSSTNGVPDEICASATLTKRQAQFAVSAIGASSQLSTWEPRLL